MKRQTMVIVVHYDPPPIPYRDCDWQAWIDDFGADSSPRGFGKSAARALDDLTWQIDEMEDCRDAS